MTEDEAIRIADELVTTISRGTLAHIYYQNPDMWECLALFETHLVHKGKPVMAIRLCGQDATVTDVLKMRMRDAFAQLAFKTLHQGQSLKLIE